MATRAWIVTTRFVPGGQWESYVRETDPELAEEMMGLPESASAFGGGKSAATAASQALSRALGEEG